MYHILTLTIGVDKKYFNAHYLQFMDSAIHKKVENLIKSNQVLNHFFPLVYPDRLRFPLPENRQTAAEFQSSVFENAQSVTDAGIDNILSELVGISKTTPELYFFVHSVDIDHGRQRLYVVNNSRYKSIAPTITFDVDQTPWTAEFY
jgi:hypothetical protein